MNKMETRQSNIRAAARRLLEEGAVEAVLGYRRGTVPGREQAFAARTPEEADLLVWSSFCTGNLAKLALGFKGRVAICAQGCVSRNILGLIRERQLSRENVHVLGAPCLGMLDRRKVQARVGESWSLEEAGEEVILRHGDQETRVKRNFLLRDNCSTCLHRNPQVYDELMDELLEGAAAKGPGNIENTAGPWEKLAPAARRARFAETYEACIRCYACRDVCPLCYCTQCFVDEAGPQWCGKTQDPADVQTYHLLRAFHCAGRCTDCGACESACPLGLKVRRLTSKLEKDVRELWSYEPWLGEESDPPLQIYQPDDPQESFK